MKSRVETEEEEEVAVVVYLDLEASSTTVATVEEVTFDKTTLPYPDIIFISYLDIIFTSISWYHLHLDMLLSYSSWYPDMIQEATTTLRASGTGRHTTEEVAEDQGMASSSKRWAVQKLRGKVTELSRQQSKDGQQKENRQQYPLAEDQGTASSEAWWAVQRQWKELREESIGLAT